MSGTPECIRCGAPVPGDGVRAAARCACCPAGRPTIGRHGAFCSTSCQRAAAFRSIAKRSRCAHCQKEFDDEHIDAEGRSTIGRPRAYCSTEHRQAAESIRAQAMKELAKDKTNYRSLDDWNGALQRAIDLHEFWCGRGPTRPHEQPADGARQALRERIDRLKDGRSAAANEQAQKDAAEREQKYKRSWMARREREAQAAKQWREQLLKT